MKILHLTLKNQWFDMILSGEKKEEYREIKPYWSVRLTTLPTLYCQNTEKVIMTMKSSGEFECDYAAFFTHIQFRNGYAKNAPTMLVECKSIRIGTPRPEWSGNMQGDHFIIELGNIIKTENV